MNLVIPHNEYRIIQAAAIEVYAKESLGLLLGVWKNKNTAIVTGVYIHQDMEIRTKHTIRLEDEPQYRIQDWFNGSVIGDWHSHVDGWPTISRIRDFNDKPTKELTDEWGMLNDPYNAEVTLVIGICPRVRKPYWSFRTGCYYVDKGKVRKGTVKCLKP